MFRNVKSGVYVLWSSEVITLGSCLLMYVLTPKIGTGRRLICGPNLITNSIRQGRTSSKDSAKMPAVGNAFSFDKRTVCAGFAGSRGDVARTKGKDGWIGIHTWH
jgi:hypothetical protein